MYFHNYLALRVRAAGDPVLHKSYYVNVQTLDRMSHTTLWRHPLNFRRQDNDWETVYVNRFLSFIFAANSHVLVASVRRFSFVHNWGAFAVSGRADRSRKYIYCWCCRSRGQPPRVWSIRTWFGFHLGCERVGLRRGHQRMSVVVESMSPVCSTAFINRFDSTSGTLHRKDTLKRRPSDRGSLCRDTVF